MKTRTKVFSLLLLFPALLLSQPKEVIDAYNLNQAIIKNDVEKVKKMIDDGYDLNYQYNGRAALHTACYEDLTEISGMLIKAGADVNAYSEEGLGRTPLQFVAGDPMKDLPELLELLLKNGADPNLSLDPNQIPLFEAIDKAHVKSVKMLLEHGAGTELKNTSNQTPLDFINYKVNQVKGDACTEAKWKKIQVILNKK